VADQPQPLDALSLIRRKRGGEGANDPPLLAELEGVPLRMKPREVVQRTAVHVRIPEQIARGLRLMSVLENRQAQDLVAEAIERMLDSWSSNWRDAVPKR
jgi:hypothetical protein